MSEFEEKLLNVLERIEEDLDSIWTVMSNKEE